MLSFNKVGNINTVSICSTEIKSDKRPMGTVVSRMTYVYINLDRWLDFQRIAPTSSNKAL